MHCWKLFFTQVYFFYHLSSLYPLPCVRALAGAHHDNRFCVMERRICFVHLEVINQWVMGFVLVDKIGKNDFVNDFFHVFVFFLSGPDCGVSNSNSTNSTSALSATPTLNSNIPGVTATTTANSNRVTAPAIAGYYYSHLVK